ncbi:hypothetical protein N7471_002221 [Penicillium samsonianum]|uniref:uncharacterized protein n=1 Tax=Penicillium samsonianum TaxID=1882272 RepID=UPI002549253F|nr:uncharacterized protein N7471_002221 [Penicillium samsonianum]KAJ6142768.1 hypothetical protein N7471_002221 [Penicillium samsonianum]
MLAGRASTHVSCARSSGTLRLSDAVCLTDSLNNFILQLDADPPTSAPYGYFASIAPRFLAWSALIMVLDSYACPETLQAGMGISAGKEAQNGDEAEMQVLAVQQLRDVSEQTNQFTNELLKFITSVPDPTEQLDQTLFIV